MRVLFIVVALVVTAGVPGFAVAAPAAQPDAKALSELPIGMMVHPASLDYFNQTARPDDVGAVLVVNTRLLSRITAGQRLVMSPSVDLAEERANDFVDNAEYFGYNIEHWPDTPASEKGDPVVASEAAAEFARAHGLGYVIGPDLQFTEEAGAALAQTAEIYVIQGQRLQERVSFFETTVTNFAQMVRSGNPEVQVWVQVSSSFGTPEATLGALRTVQPYIDGIWIHYNQNTQSFEALKELVGLLRPGAGASVSTPATRDPAATSPASPLADSADDAATPTSGAVAPLVTAAAPTATPLPTVPPADLLPDAPAEVPVLPWLPLIGAGMFALAGGLIVFGFALGYVWNNWRGDPK